MSFGNYLEQKLLEQAFGARSFTPAATLYVHLYTGAPSDTGGGTEVSTGVWTNYAAVSVTNNDTNWGGYEDNSELSNAVEISFGTASISGTPPVVTHFAVKDGSGNLYGWAALTVSKTVYDGSVVKFATGALHISMD